MPKFKLSGAKAVEQKSGFEPYDGPEPTRPGFYRAIVKVMKHGLNVGSGSQGFSITLELEAAAGDPKGHAMFDGMPMFSRNIITSSSEGVALKEGAQRNLSNLLAALGTGDDPDVVLAEGDADKLDVKKIGRVNPIGRVVNVEMGFELYEGSRRPQVAGIHPYKEIDAPTGTGRASVLEDDEPDDEADLMDEPDAPEADEADEADEYDARAEELEGLGIPALKKIAKELEINVSGTKPKLIERILEAEFAEEDEADEADEEEPDDEPDDADEAEDDEPDDDEAEEEDDEDEAARAERIAELAEMNRVALKAILKEIAPDTTVLKRHTDDDLRKQIIDVEFGEDLPF